MRKRKALPGVLFFTTTAQLCAAMIESDRLWREYKRAHGYGVVKYWEPTKAGA